MVVRVAPVLTLKPNMPYRLLAKWDGASCQVLIGLGEVPGYPGDYKGSNRPVFEIAIDDGRDAAYIARALRMIADEIEAALPVAIEPLKLR